MIYEFNSKQVSLSFFRFFNCRQAADGIQVSVSSDGFLGGNQGFQIQEAKLAVREICEHALFTYRFEIANAGNFTQAIQLSEIGLQIQVLQVPKGASGRFQWQLVGGKAMNWVEVFDRCFNPTDILLAKRTADIEIESGQQSTVVYDAHTADDDEVEAHVPETHQ